MLKINVRGENIEVTGAIREYVEKRLAKLEKFFDNTADSTAHVKGVLRQDCKGRSNNSIAISCFESRRNLT